MDPAPPPAAARLLFVELQRLVGCGTSAKLAICAVDLGGARFIAALTVRMMKLDEPPVGAVDVVEIRVRLEPKGSISGSVPAHDRGLIHDGDI
jgi:hypothetical protein